ncbi:MAG: hypothetical protein ABSC06_35180 [Rhodopila sp.]|jgi:hypothetical protein
MLTELLKLLQPWFALLGSFAAIAALLVAAAYGLFRLLGEKWLNSKFEERLAAYKHAQQRELEQLKFEINTLMDRTTKLHQREFDVLPEIWGKANDAFSAALSIGFGLQRYPDLNSMNGQQLDSFLEKSELEAWQKAEIRKAPDKTRYYIGAIAPIDLWNAEKARIEFSGYLSRNGIFIPEPIDKQFKAVDQLLFDVVNEYRISLQEKGVGGEKRVALLEKGRPGDVQIA